MSAHAVSCGRIFLSACCVFGVVAGGIAQEKPVSLAWKFNRGESQKVEMLQNVDVQMSIAGQNVNSTTSNKSWMTWDVSDVTKEGHATIATTIDRMTLDIGGAVEIHFDSDDKEKQEAQAEAIAKMIRPLIGVEMRQKMLTTGKITEVTIPDSIKEAMDSMGTGGSQMLESVSRNATLEFPEKALRAGDSWSNTFETKSAVGLVTVDTTYTYKGLVNVEDKPLHLFDVDLQMKFADGENPSGAKIEIVKQSTDGKMYFDAAAGRIDHSSVKQNVEMNISAGGQNIQQTMRQTIEMRFTEA
ncbi:MAG: hypothetical protein R3C05_29375 [Pirellulaceae bacterium]